jgi:hypothetical protein
MLLVKPSFGAFVPADGNSIGLSWSKSQIVPITMVKPFMGGFIPIDGTALDNMWAKSEVKPVVFVEPYLGMFVAGAATRGATQPIVPAPPNPSNSNSSRPTLCNPAIETRISGDFNGWDDETIYKMDDGSIWRQTNYHYHYHYAYHPSVTIFPNRSGACHILVEGDSDEGVDVERIN